MFVIVRVGSYKQPRSYSYSTEWHKFTFIDIVW